MLLSPSLLRRLEPCPLNNCSIVRPTNLPCLSSLLPLCHSILGCLASPAKCPTPSIPLSIPTPMVAQHWCSHTMEGKPLKQEEKMEQLLFIQIVHVSWSTLLVLVFHPIGNPDRRSMSWRNGISLSSPGFWLWVVLTRNYIPYMSSASPPSSHPSSQRDTGV